jgi:hypothetical protein
MGCCIAVYAGGIKDMSLDKAVKNIESLTIRGVNTTIPVDPTGDAPIAWAIAYTPLENGYW